VDSIGREREEILVVGACIWVLEDSLPAVDTV
jgi:hypothetical protein